METPPLKPKAQALEIGGLLASLREVIQTARQQALRAVDVVQVRTCWTVGRHIIEFEQGGAARAAYGKRLLADLAESLTAEFGRGFDERNLRHMRAFYAGFPNWNALRSELSWTHYRALLRVEESAARLWYMNEAADQNWNTRALDRQTGISRPSQYRCASRIEARRRPYRQSPVLPSRTRKGLRLRRAPTAHQHGIEGFLP